MFHDLHIDEFTTGRSHMVVFIILYDLRVNFFIRHVIGLLYR
jgi:hypothetical protein